MAKMTALRAILGGLGGAALGYGKQQELKREEERQRRVSDLQMAQLGFLPSSRARSGAAARAVGPAAEPAPTTRPVVAPGAALAPEEEVPAEPFVSPRAPEPPAPATAFGGRALGGFGGGMYGGGIDFDSILSDLSDERPTVEIGGVVYEKPSRREEAMASLRPIIFQSALQQQQALQKRAQDNAEAYMTGRQMFPDRFADLPFDPYIDYKAIYENQAELEKNRAELIQNADKTAREFLRNTFNDYEGNKEIQEFRTRATFLQTSIDAADRGIEAFMGGDQEAMKSADIALLYAYITALDPGSVVREGELLLVLRSSALTDELETLINRVNKGGLISQDMRRSLRSDSLARAKSFRDDWDARTERQINYLNAVGVPPEKVIDDPFKWVSQYDAPRTLLDNY